MGDDGGLERVPAGVEGVNGRDAGGVGTVVVGVGGCCAGAFGAVAVTFVPALFRPGDLVEWLN